MSAVLLTVIVALATAPPEESVTTPVIFPVTATCAEIMAGKKQTKAKVNKMRFFIAPPPFVDQADRLGRENQESSARPQIAPASDHETLSVEIRMDYVQNSGRVK